MYKEKLDNSRRLGLWIVTLIFSYGCWRVGVRDFRYLLREFGLRLRDDEFMIYCSIASNMIDHINIPTHFEQAV